MFPVRYGQTYRVELSFLNKRQNMVNVHNCGSCILLYQRHKSFALNVGKVMRKLN
jgi:hypothetical protein